MPVNEMKTTATWWTPPSGDIWDKLKSLGVADKDSPGFLRLGPVLPTGEERRMATVSVHQCIDNEIHWTLTVRPAPTAEAPDRIRERDLSLGGRSGLATLLAHALPAGSDIASFKTQLRIPEAEFTCAALPVKLDKNSGHDTALRFGREARLEQVGYRFEGGANGIGEIAIIYLHSEGEYLINLNAYGPLKLSSDTWLPFANEIRDVAIGAFFALKDPGK